MGIQHAFYTQDVRLPQPLLGHIRGWKVEYLLLQDILEA